MDEIAASGFNGGTAVAKRPRSSTSRRPRQDSQTLVEGRDPSPPSTTPSSENASRNSTDGSSSHEAGVRRKEVDLNSLLPKTSSRNEGATSSRKIKKDDLSYRDYDGGLAPSSWKNSDGDQSESAPGGGENRVRKVKLKVGGVTRTIHAKSNGEGSFDGGGGSSSKPPRPDDPPRHRQKLPLKEKGEQWRDFSDQSFAGGSKEADDREQSSEPLRKSKRVPKRRLLDSAYDGDDADEEIRYLEKLKASRLAAEQQETSGSESRKKQKGPRVSRRVSYEEDDDFSLQPRPKDGRKKPRSDEEEGASDESDSLEKRAMQESLDPASAGAGEARKELSLTTRQRALQTGRDGNGGAAGSLIEYPDGLPPAPPRRQKGKLSDVEQQLKKAEAAQRRRLQVEKAARESEAEAIRKILGQDSNRKKREEKLQKKREERAQEKAAKSMALAANTVRWVLGPEGTTVTFPEAVGLPSLFDSRPCSYPAPREKCAGPTCKNPYRYRHSKLNLPLCSLQCYRAVEQVAAQQ